ncbi:hypothetical protein [Rathayibacter sp. VKM Ac-2630]|uniref:hypothetical protein n=1 Tax=Rathayibacter sp. VKM Ac-2630 TaxID=1938617 RepID=UPI00098143DA|nr:hypothetical protein [Rathayibacter sp. VKM Ac-2630]OOB91208.1 hypothetical protein B0T42_07370 [Rathayibacter sp. VKM Ac-2630]
MNDDTVRALVRETRSRSARLERNPRLGRSFLDQLADALEWAISSERGDAEWEYSLRVAERGSGLPGSGGPWKTHEEAVEEMERENAVEKRKTVPYRYVIVRRRVAGPWEPIPDDPA